MKGGYMVSGINAISSRSFGNGIVSIPKSPQQIAKEEIKREKNEEKLEAKRVIQ